MISLIQKIINSHSNFKFNIQRSFHKPYASFMNASKAIFVFCLNGRALEGISLIGHRNLQTYNGNGTTIPFSRNPIEVFQTAFSKQFILKQNVKHKYSKLFFQDLSQVWNSSYRMSRITEKGFYFWIKKIQDCPVASGLIVETFFPKQITYRSNVLLFADPSLQQSSKELFMAQPFTLTAKLENQSSTTTRRRPLSFLRVIQQLRGHILPNCDHLPLLEWTNIYILYTMFPFVT